MGLGVAGLVLASAFLHALWNAMIKADEDTTTAGVVVLALSGILAGLFSLAVPGTAFPRTEGIWWALLSGLFETSYFLSLIWCLSRGPLGQVYSFSRGGALLVVWPISVLTLGEPFLPIHAAGGLAILIGLIAAGYEKRVEQPARAPAGETSPSLLLPLIICATSIAGYHLLYKRAMLTGAQPLAVFAVSMLLAAPSPLVYHRAALRRRWTTLRWKTLLAASVLCTLSFVFALVALEHAGAGWVLTLRNTSVGFALFFSWRMGEEVKPRRVYGTALIAVGALLLGWS